MMEKSWKFGGLKFGVVEVSDVVVDDDDDVVVVVRGSLCSIHLVLSLPLKNGMPINYYSSRHILHYFYYPTSPLLR